MDSSLIRARGIRFGLQALGVIALLNIAIMVVSAQSSISTGPDSANSQSFIQQRRSGASPDAIKLATVLVSVPVTVTDRSGRAINGLKREDFRVYENRVEQPISFFTDEDAPASIGVVFDISGSMSDGKIIQAKKALSRFIQTSHEQDEYFLISFNSTPHLLLDGTRDAQAILDEFKNVHPGGETALYDAVSLGIEEVSHGIYPKRAIILISDGEDNHSRYTFNQLRRSVEESDVAIYSIGIGGFIPRRAMSQVVMDSLGRVVMENLASISGGRAFRPWDTKEMDEAFEQIALELRRQYSIGYVPSNYVADGKLHRIRVTLAVPPSLSQLVVRNREWYHAVKKPDGH